MDSLRAGVSLSLRRSYSFLSNRQTMDLANAKFLQMVDLRRAYAPNCARVLVRGG